MREENKRGDKIKQKIKEIIRKEKEEKRECLEGWKRAKADLLNYKKDELKRINNHLFYERKRILLKIISILDSFNRAEKEIEKTQDDEIINGLLIIKKQIEAFLTEEGVEEIKALGKEFDPHFHEAIEMIKTDNNVESGLIVEEIEKGYILEGEIIRASKVKVSQ